MTKYVLIDGKKKRNLDEKELLNFTFDNLTEQLSSSLLNEYYKLEKNIIFSNYGNYFKRRSKINYKCSEEGCSNQPILSHSISKNSVLKNIANKGEVYSPTITNTSISMKRVGIETQASVFPGFCKHHDEKLFSELDKPNLAKYSRVFFDQLAYRTIKREIYCLKRNLSFAELMLDKLQLVLKESKNNTLNKFNSLQTSDYRISNFNSDKCSLQDRFDKIKNIKDKNLCDLNSFLNFYNNQGPYNVSYAKVDLTLPVAFAGFTKFYSKNRFVYLLIYCLPYKTHTLFCHINAKVNNEIIEKDLLSQYDLEDSDSLLNFLELLSVKGTDNIFFDINYWDSLNEVVKNKFIRDFSNFNSSDLRKRINYSFLKWNYDK